MAAKKSQDISINLNCYTIRFHKRGDKSTFLSMKDVFGNTSFKDFTQKFIKSIDVGCYSNAQEDRILRLQQIITGNKKDLISGIIKKGHSSHERDIENYNRKSRKATVVNKITAAQFDTSPFYFLLSQPSIDKKAMIFLAQSYKQYGFKELFEEAFKAFFKLEYGNSIICEFGTLSISSLFKQYIDEGRVRKLRLRKYSLIPELENVVLDDDANLTDYEMEMSIKAKRGVKTFMDRLKGLDLEDGTFLELFEVDGYEFDEVLVDVSAGNRKRVLNFSKPDSFAASYDVSDEIHIDKDTKHPNFEQLNKEAIRILNTEVKNTIK